VVVGVLGWDLHIYEAQSLKDKRAVVRSLKDRLRTKLNVSVAETGAHDRWQRAEITVCVVATDRRHAESVLDSADRLVEAEARGRIIDSYRNFY
jgi:uncharacterized protein